MTSTLTANSADREAASVRSMSARFLQAADTRDASQVTSFYAADGTFLVPNAPIARGRDAIRAVWTQLLGAPNLSLSWTTTSVDVSQGADMACEIGTYRLGMTGPNGPIEDEGKYVVVWRKGADAWEVLADIFNSSRAPAGT